MKKSKTRTTRRTPKRPKPGTHAAIWKELYDLQVDHRELVKCVAMLVQTHGLTVQQLKVTTHAVEELRKGL
jgi:hypothetical protein